MFVYIVVIIHYYKLVYIILAPVILYAIKFSY